MLTRNWNTTIKSDMHVFSLMHAYGNAVYIEILRMCSIWFFGSYIGLLVNFWWSSSCSIQELIAKICSYDLGQADLAVASFCQLSVVNLRRLYANNGSLFMNPQKLIIETAPPRSKFTTDHFLIHFPSILLIISFAPPNFFFYL